MSNVNIEQINMRKYRYTDPKSPAGRRYAIGQFIKFFIGWNLVGCILWSGMKSAARKNDPDFDKKSANEKILSMMGKKDEKLVKYHVKIGQGGISVTKASDKDSSENNQGTNQNVCDSSKEDSENGSDKNR